MKKQTEMKQNDKYGEKQRISRGVARVRHLITDTYSNWKEKPELHVSQEHGVDTNTLCGFVHPFVVRDESGICQFGTSDENYVKTTNPSFGCNGNSLVKELNIASILIESCNLHEPKNSCNVVENRVCEIHDKSCRFFSNIFRTCESGNNCSSFNNSNGRNMHLIFARFNTIDNRLCYIMHPDLFSANSIIFDSSRLYKRFYKNSGVKSERCHCLSRIFLISSDVSELSFTRELTFFESSESLIFGFLDLMSANIECSSWSNNSSLFSMSITSFMNNNVQYLLFKDAYVSELVSSDIIFDQISHVFLDFLFCKTLSSNVKGRTGSNEPLTFFCNLQRNSVSLRCQKALLSEHDNRKRYFDVSHNYHDFESIDDIHTGDYLMFAAGGENFASHNERLFNNDSFRRFLA